MRKQGRYSMKESRNKFILTGKSTFKCIQIYIFYSVLVHCQRVQPVQPQVKLHVQALPRERTQDRPKQAAYQ